MQQTVNQNGFNTNLQEFHENQMLIIQIKHKNYNIGVVSKSYLKLRGSSLVSD